ncbi:MAG: ABC transporter permease [Dehalococcoidaceae bacterium]|nr:ABC transporter permease [Dehalococcoidaceae bacterium]
MITLIKKEVRELLSKSALMFFALMALMFVFLGQTLSSTIEDSAVKPVIGIVDRDGSFYSAIVAGTVETAAELVYSGLDETDALVAVEARSGAAVLTIPEGFQAAIESGEQAQIHVLWLMQGAGVIDSIPTGSVQAVLQAATQALSSFLIEQHTQMDADIILSPISTHHNTLFKGRMIEGATPGVVSGMLSMRTMFIPVIIMMLIVMGSSSVISSMGLEKENRTLETLLTLPVKRSHIVISKIVGSGIVGIFMGAIYMVGFVSYFNAIGGQAGSLADYGFSLNIIDYLLIALSLFGALLSALCGAIILGLFASNYRSAQTLTYPLIGLAMISMLMTMMLDFATLSLPLKTLVFLIPFTHPMIAMKELLTGNYLLVAAGVVYCFAVTAALVIIATRIFTTDRVVLGMTFKRRKGAGVSQ